LGIFCGIFMSTQFDRRGFMKNLLKILLLLLVFWGGFYYYQTENSPEIVDRAEDKIPTPVIKIDRLILESDQDGDGLLDLDDLLEGARKEVENQPRYKSAYYSGGYPPEDEGVCTDVIWRAYKNAGYDLKALIDKDIRENTEDYPRVEGNPDPNIDFRRVPNLLVFFKKYGEELTLELKPNDPENLKEWQGGDIVVYGAPLWHIAFVSDKRRADGIPFIIHNAGPTPREEDYILKWTSPMIGHFRFPKGK
jgi:uncharacterized protein YijF (DUF1287 family)